MGTNTLSLNSVGSEFNNKKYRVVVTNAYGSATSNVATLTVDTGSTAGTAPTFTVQPQAPAGQPLPGGTQFTLTAEATGSGVISYQWYGGLGANTLLPGETTTSLTRTASAGSTNSYKCVATNEYGSTSSQTVSVTAQPSAPPPPAELQPPVITQQPTSSSYVIGSGSAELTIAVTSSILPLSYSLFYDGTNELVEQLAGTNNELHTFNVAPTVTKSYYIKVSNADGEVTSNVVTVTPQAAPATAPSISQHPYSGTITSGDSVTLSVVASGTDPLSYQWYENGVVLSGETSTMYVASPTVTGTAYYCTVSNSAGTVTSNTATITVLPPAPPPPPPPPPPPEQSEL